MTSANNQQILVLRDGAGNYYGLTAATVQAGRLSADQVEQIKQDISGQQDVSGFLFNTNLFNTANFAALSQSSTQNANNIAVGGFVQVGSQTALNVSNQQAGISQQGA